MSGGCDSYQWVMVRGCFFASRASLLEYALRFRLNVFEAEQVESK